MTQRKLEPVNEAPRPSEEGCLEVAAVVEQRTHTSGVGWRLTSEGHPALAQARTLRRAGTLISAELTAIREGLRASLRSGCRTLLVRVADRRAVALLRGERPGTMRRAEARAERLRPLLERFATVRFESDFLANPDLAHIVGEALDAGLHTAATQQQHRVWAMEQIVERARSVRLRKGASGWVANDRYRVQLDPMRCECPAWTARWANAPIGARRAQRLPCKHLVALAIHEGITVPIDLAQLARRAPE
jgi:hypothetical protein